MTTHEIHETVMRGAVDSVVAHGSELRGAREQGRFDGSEPCVELVDDRPRELLSRMNERVAGEAESTRHLFLAIHRADE